jgi:DNA-binding Xre family transcriptional regulator
MPITVRLDVMLARRKVRSKELAEAIGITESNLSLLKSGKVRVLDLTWTVSQEIFSNTSPRRRRRRCV